MKKCTCKNSCCKGLKQSIQDGKLLQSLFRAQFSALLKKDIIQLAQGGTCLLAIRLIIPIIACFAIYATQFAYESFQMTATPQSFKASQMRLPRCYAIASSADREGMGSRKNSEGCKTVAYYPDNNVTRAIIQQTMAMMNTTAFYGYKTREDYDTQNLKLFAVEFSGNFTDFDSALLNMSILIRYNHTYIEQPHYYVIYGDERFGTELKTNNIGVDVIVWSSFPLAIQSNVMRAIMALKDVSYDPIFRQNPFALLKGKPVPPKELTLILVQLIFVVQIVFVCVNIQNDKNGTLTALRLSGVSTFTYLFEKLVFEYMIFIAMCIGQLYVLKFMPYGCQMYPYIDLSVLTITFLVGGLYCTTVPIFFGSISNMTNTVVISLIALYIILILCFEIFGQVFAYDTSIFKMLCLPFRWLYPSAQLQSAVIIMQYRARLSSKVDQNTLSQYLTASNYTWGNFTTNTSNSPTIGSSKTQLRIPSCAEQLLTVVIQAIILFIVSNLLEDWIPGDASTCLSPWQQVKRLFQPKQNVSYTIGSINNQKQKQHASKINQACRQQLSVQQAKKCLAETSQQVDGDLKLKSIDIMTKNIEKDTIFISHHLHKTYNRNNTRKTRLLQGNQHLAVESVSIQVKRGEIFGLAGHNGAGKSTTLNMIIGAIPIGKAGYSLFDSNKWEKKYINNAWLNSQYSIRSDVEQLRKLISVCPQFNSNVYQNLSVYQNLELMCRIQNIPYYDHSRIIQRLLKSMLLEEWQNHKLSQLSGGMQRRISIAMALVSYKSELLIFDEPSTGLDPLTKRIIWMNIKRAAREHRKCPVISGSLNNIQVHRIQQNLPGIILTSHDMDELNTIADTVQIMSAGQIVASGTPLELKRKFGKGFVLTIICNNTDSCKIFCQWAEQQIIRLKLNDDMSIIDCSGAVVQYSVSTKAEIQLIQLLQLVELLIIDGNMVNDYHLERTSLDEVFVAVGTEFDLANGAYQLSTQKKMPKNVFNQQPNSILGNDEDEKISTIELESDEENDIKFNGDLIKPENLTKKEIQNILQPAHGTPQTLRALFYKHYMNDKLNRKGWLTYIIFPILLMLVIYLLNNVLIPLAGQALSASLQDTIKNVTGLCDYCNQLKYLDVPMTDCQGYSAWANPNLCTLIDIMAMSKVSPPAVWYGGDLYTWPDASNIWSEMEEPIRVLTFDQNQIFGKADNNVLALGLQGIRIQQKQNLNISNYNIEMTIAEYQLTNRTGNIVTQQLMQKLSSIVSEVHRDTSVMGQMPIKPIAVQQITPTSDKLERFNIYRDMLFYDGFEQFDSIDEYDSVIQYQLATGIKYDWFPVARNLSSGCGWAIDCIHMDDFYAIQYLKRQIAIQVPIGFLATNSTDLMNTTPLISTFTPGRTNPTYYNNIKIGTKWANSAKLNDALNLLGKPDFMKQMSMDYEYRHVPSSPPTVAPTKSLDDTISSPHSSFIDINSRLGTGILRAVTSKNINIRFGVQAYPYQPLDLVDVMIRSLAVLLTTAITFVAGFGMMAKLGAHFALDRQSGFRRMLHLNGVLAWQYWLVSVTYIAIVALVIQIIIFIVGAYVFSIDNIARIDPGAAALVITLQVLTCTSTTLFLATFSKSVPIFNLTAVLVTLLCVVPVFASVGRASLEAPWYAFAFPAAGYSFILAAVSQFGLSISDLFQTNYGSLVVWCAIYSVVLILVSYVADIAMPLNGYVGFRFKRCMSTNKFRPHVELNPIPSNSPIKSKRDAAAAHSERRMDQDVLAERQNIANGQQAPIVVQNLQKRFSKFTALRDVSFTVKTGEVFALLGPNGSAKTTTISAMTGLMRPTSGRVLLHGRDVSDPKQIREVYKKLGLCPQFDVFLPNLTVRQHLVIFAVLHGVQWTNANKVAEDLAAFVQLGEALDKTVGQLSGGMRRRMSLGLALVG